MIWLVIYYGVVLVAGIMGLQASARPEKLGTAFGWAIAGAALSLLGGNLITMALLIIAAVYSNMPRTPPWLSAAGADAARASLHSCNEKRLNAEALLACLLRRKNLQQPGCVAVNGRRVLAATGGEAGRPHRHVLGEEGLERPPAAIPGQVRACGSGDSSSSAMPAAMQ